MVRKRIRSYNIAKTLDCKSNEWLALKKKGLTPPADGQMWSGSSVDDFWYEDTLVRWWDDIRKKG